MIFDKINNAVFGAGNNQGVIGAPGAGLAIIIQSISVVIGAGAAADVTAAFHPAGGGTIAVFALLHPTDCSNISFPGGIKLPANTVFQVDIAGGAMSFTVTSTIGPA